MTAVVAAVALVLGASFAFFSDTLSATADATAGTLNIEGPLQVYVNGELAGDTIANLDPGDVVTIKGGVTNTGNKATWVRYNLVVTPASADIGQYLDADAAADAVAPVVVGAGPYTSGWVGPNGEGQDPAWILNGTGTAAEIETDGVDSVPVLATVTFDPDATNAAEGVGVHMEVTVEAVQYRNNPNPDWADADSLTGSFGVGTQPTGTPSPGDTSTVTPTDTASVTPTQTPAAVVQPYFLAWGYNADGELGDGTTTDQLTPEKVPLPDGVTFTQISAGMVHTLAIGSDGNVWAWGDLGDGTTTDQLTPVKVTLAPGVTATEVAAGDGFSLAIGSDGAVYTWGQNNHGQLGNGTSDDGDYIAHPTPGKITLAAGVRATAIACGQVHCLAIGSDNKLYTWGGNSGGELGDGTTTDRSTPAPVTVSGCSPVAIAAAIGSSYVLGANGGLWAWGDNQEGELGIGSSDYNAHPSPVTITLAAGVSAKAISAGGSQGYACLAIGSDNNLYAWGDNGYGQIGNSPGGGYQLTPVKITLAPGVTPTAISAGGFDCLALGSDGHLYAWGYNAAGEVGDGTTTNRPTPVQVTLPDGAVPTTIEAGAVLNSFVIVAAS